MSLNDPLFRVVPKSLEPRRERRINRPGEEALSLFDALEQNELVSVVPATVPIAV